ncbi:MAG: Pili retraction protein [Puniceicoccaceae bacterium 5H]|nr:MAG: Pili retraction protein [Puniceicoccaceae bacterium 5H]
MRPEVIWFAYLAVQRGVLDEETCRRLSVAAGDNADVVTFAELLLEYTITDDFDLVQQILDEAAAQDWSTLPPSDPFKPVEPAKPRISLPSRARKGADEQVPPPEPEPETPPASEPPLFREEEPTPPAPVEPAPKSVKAPPPEPPKRKPISLRSSNAPSKRAKPEPAPPAAQEPTAPEKPAAGGGFLDEIAGLVQQIETGAPQKSRGAPAGQPGPANNATGDAGAAQGNAGTAGAPPAAAVATANAGPVIRPPEHVVPTASAKPALPRFEQLDQLPSEQLARHMVGLLMAATRDGASDVHLSAASRPFVREQGKIRYLGPNPLSPRLVRHLVRSVLSTEQWQHFEAENDFDFGLAFDNGMRFRTNLMRHKDGVQGVFRTVRAEVPTLEELGFSDAERIRKLLSYHNGLILVTGPLGSGKTTTLAAMIGELNEKRQDHVIVLEEPIENVFASKQCQITQRSVGPHTRSFKKALKGALRQDPDVIVIGEMRDLETIEMAISASETGHLVIGTMHTSDSATTLNRLLDVFPPAQQPQIRAMVAESLRGIVCQRLLPAQDGGVALASELLLRNMAVSVLIREGKTQNLGNVMETGKRDGMRLMDSSILDLWRNGRISDEVASANLRNRMLMREISGEGTGGATEDEFASFNNFNAAPKKRGLFR